MSALFHQVPPRLIVPHIRVRGFGFQFAFAPWKGGWVKATEQVYDWYHGHYDDPTCDNVKTFGRAVFFKDPDVAFAFKMRFC